MTPVRCSTNWSIGQVVEITSSRAVNWCENWSTNMNFIDVSLHFTAQLSWSSIATVSRRSRVRVPLKPWYFQASSFQLLKLENVLRWSLFTLHYQFGTLSTNLRRISPLLVQKKTKHTEDCCVNSLIFSFVFFVLTYLNSVFLFIYFSLGKPKKPLRAQKRGKKSNWLLRHLNARLCSRIHDLRKINPNANFSTW